MGEQLLINMNKLPDTITINTEAGLITPPSIGYGLITVPNPIFSQVAPIWNFSKNSIEIANSLIDVLQKHEGLGLSACQIGRNERVFVMGVDDEFVAFFNPEIVEKSQSTSMMKEGCLSIPNFYVSVRRSDWVDVKYQDYAGNEKTGYFTGLTAKVFAHELDHLNGILITDIAGPMAMKLAKKAQKKMEKQNARNT